MRRFLTFLLLMGVLFSLAVIPGNAAGEIEIASVEHLLKIGRDPSYPLNGSYALVADLDLKGRIWHPIGNEDGTESKPFSGSFDGRGHTISNMTSGTEAKPLAHKDDGWGMFSYLTGDVRNLVLENTYFNVYAEYDVSDGVPEGYNGVGAVAGYLGGGGVIEKVAVVNSTLADFGSRQTRVGGIVGSVTGTGGTVRDCLFYGTVLGSFRYFDKLDNLNNRCAVAGIVGSVVERCTVERCLAVGTVSLNGGYGFAHPIAANYMDYATGATMKDCFHNVTVDVGAFGSFGTGKGGSQAVSDEELFGGTFPSLGDGWQVAEGILPHPVDSVQIHATALENVTSLLTDAFESVTVTNYTVEQDILDHASRILQGAFTVSFADSFRMTKATDQPGEITCSLKVTCDEGDVTVPLKLSLDPVPEITYTFTSSVKGSAQGNLSLKFTTKNFIPHSLRWGDAKGAFEEFTPLSSFDDNGKTVRIAIRRKTVIPDGVTHLWLYKEDVPVISLEIPEERRLTVSEPEYVFGLVSDLHLDNSSATEAVDGMMRSYAANHVDFLVSLGDNTSSNKVEQLMNWKTLKMKYPTLNMYSVLGNHDILPRHTEGSGLTTFTDAEFRAKVSASLKRFQSYFENTVDYDYTLEQGDDLIIFLGLGTADEVSEAATKGGQALGQAQLDWLDDTLDQYYNKDKKSGHVFLMFHFYARNTFDTVTTASALQEGSSKKLEAVLAKYKGHEIIYFSGHNHYAFDVGMNIYDNHAGYTMLHCPSASRSSNLKDTGHNLGREGYYVEVYGDYVIARGYSFLRDQSLAPVSYLLSAGDSLTLTNPTESVTVGGSVSAPDPSPEEPSDLPDSPGTDGSSDTGSDSVGMIVGVGALVLLIAGGAVVILFVLKKK